jgi:hypothetical protein
MAVNNLNTPGVGIQPSLIDAKGDLLVGTAADVVNRLGVTGTTGAVLTADAGETTGLKWAAAGSVGGLVHINTTSFSAVASQEVNSVFTSTYDNYKILIRTTGSADNNIRMVLRTSVDNTANYTWGAFFKDMASSGSGDFGSLSLGAYWELGRSGGGRTTIAIDLFEPNVAVASSFVNLTSNHYTGRTASFGGGIHQDGNAYSGFKIFPNTGTITGTVTTFGYRKS